MFLPRYPLHVVLTTTTRCNLRCSHCSAHAAADRVEELARAEVLDLLAQLGAIGVVDVALSGGEPLLRRDLEVLVAHARAHGMRVGTSTNGAPLTETRARRLQRAGLSRLQVSLDGPRAVHDRIRGRGSFDRAVTAIRRSVEAGLRTHVCFTAMGANRLHLREVVDLASELGAHAFNLSQFVPVGRGRLSADVSPSGAERVLRDWLCCRARHPHMDFTAHLSGVALVDPELAATPGFIGCHAGIYIACITATGDVTPCVMLPLVLGNVRQRPFREIWDTAVPVRKLKQRTLHGACGACPHQSVCGGCRAASYAYTGDYLGDDPRCWLLDARPPEHAPPTERS